MTENPGGGNSEPIVHYQGVCLSFGSQVVLDGVDLTVHRGERLVILGQSGTGKSTLLKLLLGVLKPLRGAIFFQGHNVPELKMKELNQVRQKIGMVYQYSALISSANVRDNLALPLQELTEKSESEIDEIVNEKLEMVGMLSARSKLPSQLSGGMRKRVSLARALVMEPEVILFDEPSAGLDPVISAVIDELIVALSEETHTTSIIVTHEMDSAFRIATRMAMLYQGKMIIDDDPKAVRNAEHPVVRQFIDGNSQGPIVLDHKPA